MAKEISSFGNANVSYGLFNILEFLGSQISDYEYLWDYLPVNTLTIDVIPANLEAIKEYIPDEVIK